MADENYDEFDDIEDLELEEEEERKGPTRMERLIGPLGSLVLHVILLALVAIFVKEVVMKNENTVRAKTVKPITKEIEEIKELTEEIKELDDNNFADNPNMDFTETTDVTENSEEVETPTEVDLEALSNMQDIKSPIRLSGLFSNRSAGGRANALRMFGGGKGTEEAVLKALNWLKKNQNAAGTWDSGSKTAMAGFGVLTFLAHGETPTSKNYGKTVQSAINYLRENTKADGRFSNGDGHEYTHPIATYALAEAYAMTKIPTLREPMERAGNELIDGAIYKRFPADGSMRPINGLDDSNNGSVTGAFFDYNLKNGAYPNGSDTDYLGSDNNPLRAIYNNTVRADQSYAAFCYQALKALKQAGFYNPKLDEVIAASGNGLKFMQSTKNGHFSYANKTAIPHKPTNQLRQLTTGGYTIQLMDSSTSPEAIRSRDALYEIGFDTEFGSAKRAFYSIYYASNANFWFQGQNWDKWNPEMKKWMIKNQNADGSWSQKSMGETDTHGLVYPTCLGALSLMVYYRNLPGSQGSSKIASKPKKQKAAMVDMQIKADDKEVNMDALESLDIKF